MQALSAELEQHAVSLNCVSTEHLVMVVSMQLGPFTECGLGISTGRCHAYSKHMQALTRQILLCCCKHAGPAFGPDIIR